MNQFNHTPKDQHTTLIIVVTVIILALISTLTACNQNLKWPDDNKVQQVTIYSMGKIIKIDTAYGHITQNGYLGTIEYSRKNGSTATVKGDYIIIPLN